MWKRTEYGDDDVHVNEIAIDYNGDGDNKGDDGKGNDDEYEGYKNMEILMMSM